MSETTNYKLEKYDAGSSANLLDQYNVSMNKLDAILKQIDAKAEQALNKKHITGWTSSVLHGFRNFQ